MKKVLCLLLAAMLLVGLAGTTLATEGSPEVGPYKIAIMTGTTSQGEEEIRAAEREQKADPDHIITDTYPDQFMAEQETTVNKLMAFAADPEVKAIIVCQAVPGTQIAFQKIRESGRDDILLIAGTPQEDPAVIAAASDIVMYADEAKQGDTIMETCAKWGVDVFIHYSFPRHMAMELIVARHQVLKANAEALGIEFVDVSAPDPTAEAGPSASQQFILEDVPAQIAKYAGKKVAFFTTNCGMQEPLQTAILTQPNGYYPQPCCPSPYHGFPAVLSLKLDLAGDNNDALKAVAGKLADYDALSRFSTWPAPVAMTIIEVGTAYAKGYIEGTIEGRNNQEALVNMFKERVDGAIMETYTNVEGQNFDNYYTILLTPVDFNDYQ